MNFISRQLQSDDQKIQDIITAFGTYALGDIEHNIQTGKPVAAFLLSSCWIDQVALFVYNHNEENLDNHYQNFIKRYLKKYIQLDLYTNLRCKLVHSYSVGQNMRIAATDNLMENHTLSTNANFITAKTLHSDLKQAWNVIKSELLTKDSLVRSNALLRFDKSPTIIEVQSTIYYYTKSEAELLIEHYIPLLKGKLLNGKKSLQITSVIMEALQGYQDSFVILVIIKKSKTERLSEFLERVTNQFNLPFPTNILEKRQD